MHGTVIDVDGGRVGVAVIAGYDLRLGRDDLRGGAR